MRDQRFQTKLYLAAPSGEPALVWEICGDQLCTVVHREAFECNGRLGNCLIYVVLINRRRDC